MRAVLFDLDGVFVESKRVWSHVMRAVARRFRYPEITPEQLESAWGQGIADDARNFYPGLSVAQLETEYNLLFPQHITHLDVDPDAPCAVAALRARAIAVAVVTNSPTNVARAMLDQARIVPDVLVSGSDVLAPKPAPDGILKALRMLDTVAADAVFVGDTRYDREAARRAEIRFIGYRIDGDVRVESLREIEDLCLPNTWD